MALSTLLSLPLDLLSVRAMISETTKGPCDLSSALTLENPRRLLTSDELSNPFGNLYTTSRLLALFIPDVAMGLVEIFESNCWRLGVNGRLAYIAARCLTEIIVIIPFDVLLNRLMAGASDGTYSTQVLVRVGILGYGKDNNTLQKRSAPYKNLLDCATSIVNEEGWSALLRGWQFGVIGELIVGLAGEYL